VHRFYILENLLVSWDKNKVFKRRGFKKTILPRYLKGKIIIRKKAKILIGITLKYQFKMLFEEHVSGKNIFGSTLSGKEKKRRPTLSF
jgi:hypothetical protein